MQIIPAIDIKDGNCVRLKQGEMQSATVFSEDPAAMARHWLDLGAERLHLVDLNGAFAGKPKNELAIREVVSVIGEEIPVQLGGGIRDLDIIERYLDDGITYVLIGTAAVKNPGFLHDACYAFPGHIVVGLDAREGKVATDGWSKLTGHDVVDLAKKYEDHGVEAVVYTDIGRDGMLTGINIEATVKLARELMIPVIASGGINSLKDIKELAGYESEGVTGAIAGSALYDGMIEAVADQVFIPLTVGGGVSRVDDIRALLNAGADKVSINTAAVQNPALIAEASGRYGAQCIVAAIDARQSAPGRWEVYTHGGRTPTGLDAVD